MQEEKKNGKERGGEGAKGPRRKRETAKKTRRGSTRGNGERERRSSSRPRETS